MKPNLHHSDCLYPSRGEFVLSCLELSNVIDTVRPLDNLTFMFVLTTVNTLLQVMTEVAIDWASCSQGVGTNPDNASTLLRKRPALCTTEKFNSCKSRIHHAKRPLGSMLRSRRSVLSPLRSETGAPTTTALFSRWKLLLSCWQSLRSVCNSLFAPLIVELW